RWFADLDAFNRFREEQEAAGGEISISDSPTTHGRSPVGNALRGVPPKPGETATPAHGAGEGHTEPPTGNGQPAPPSELHFPELHEVRTINRALAALARFFQEHTIGVAFNLDLLIPQ